MFDVFFYRARKGCEPVLEYIEGLGMAETTNLNIKIDKHLKEQAETFFGELGLSMTAAFNIFVRQSLRQGKIPFEIGLAADPFYSPANQAVLQQSIQEAAEGKFISKTLDELKGMEE